MGKVRIEKLLARGGMAEVYLGTHVTLSRPVAIKLLHSHIEEEPTLLERFHREARVVAGLRHPNIVQIFDFDTTDGHPYIVMEYLRGPTLATYLRGLHARNKLIPPHQIARLFKALTAALDYAHEQGVIHRDIKPGNVMLHKKAGEIALDQPLTNDVEAILTDFGLVRIAHATTQTASGTVSGTPAYMSPEQAQGDKTDHRTDIYSLGVVLYEMLAGRVPFEADSTMSVLYMHIHNTPSPIAGVSPEVQAVLNRALAKNPSDRYQTSRDMAIDFYLAIGMNTEAQTILRTNAVTPEASAASIKRKPRKNQAWIGVGIFSFLCLLALGVGAWRLFSARTAAPIATGTVSATQADPTASVILPVTGDLAAADGMVQVDAGLYEVGLSPADDYHSTPRTIQLDQFWIDKYQVTNAQFQEFLGEEETAAQPQTWPGEADHPVRGVTWDQASAFCAWAHKRLPSEAEWEAAGRGPGTLPPRYPWGNDATASGQTIGLPDQDTYAVGTLSFNKSPFGVFDMVGNVWEWVGEPYESAQEGSKFLRGGRYGLPILDLAYRLAVAPDDTRYIKYAGFRCAADQVR